MCAETFIVLDIYFHCSPSQVIDSTRRNFHFKASTHTVSFANQGLSERNDDPASGCIENLDEGNKEGIDPGQQAEESADFAAVPTTNEIAEVPSRKKEERDPEQKKNAPHASAEPETHDPQQKSKHTPHQQSNGDSRSRRNRQPARPDRPLHEGEPPPEEAVRREGDHAEGVARLEL